MSALWVILLLCLQGCISVDSSKIDPPFVEQSAAVTVRFPTNNSLCGGVFISPQILLTAAHCAVANPGKIVHRAEIAGYTGEAIAVSRELDIAIFHFSNRSIPSPSPIPSMYLNKCSTEIFLSRKTAQTEEQIVSTSIDSMDHHHIRTVTNGDLVPCLGDSGAPLLGCHGEECQLLGLLRGGPGFCTGKDEFIAWDTIADWLVDNNLSYVVPASRYVQ